MKNLFINKKLILIFLLIFPILIEILIYTNNSSNIRSIPNLLFICIFLIYIIVLGYFLFSNYQFKFQKIFDIILKHRYLIGSIAFLVMVIFKLNFSSIGAWSNFVTSDNNKNTNLLGVSRGIRSDEWLVQSTFFLGQAMNNDEFYPLINHNVRASEGQNMLMVYAAPVADITILGKPQNLGFLLLGRDYGFSWYFAMKMILLVLFSIEIAMILSKKNSIISIIGGLWLAFSPGIMWWFSSTGDIYLYAFAIIAIFHYYINLKDDRIWKKILFGIAMSCSLAGFTFCYYPPLQIPIALVMLGFIVVDFIRNRKKLKKIDYVIMSISLLLGLSLIGYYYMNSKEAINAMLNTAYPGKRDTPGGGLSFSYMINYFTNFFTTFTGKNLESISNKSEISSFIYPFISLIIGIISYFRIRLKNKIKDNDSFLLISLVVIYIILFIWCFFGFGTFISRITLFNMCPPSRVFLILGLLGVMICIFLLSRFDEYKTTKINKSAIIFSCLICFIDILLIKCYNYDAYLDKTKLLMLVPTLFFLNYLFLSKNKKGFIYLILILTGLSGMTVNPIQIGTNAIYNTETASEIQKISQENANSIWIGRTNINAQYLIANGAKTLNGVNYYPNFDWINRIDPEGKYENIYNRYAHISVSLGDETNFELLAQDSYEVQLTYGNLKDIGINFIFSSEKINNDNLEKFKLKQLYVNEKENSYIYSVE